MNAQQLPLPLWLPAHYRAEDFVVTASNQAAHALVMGWPGTWAGAHALVLTGPEGSGKTHLAAVWAAQSHAAWWQAPLDPAAFPPQGTVVLEAAERMPDETALFHLLNRAREQQGHVLLTSALPRTAWPFTLADLRSRLNALPLAELSAPDDALLSAVATKLCADRQLAVSPDVLAYILTRIERSCAAAGRAIAALDTASLAEGRRITLPLARRVLEDL